MIQDIIVYVLILLAVFKTVLDIFKFYKNSLQKTPVCPGCTSCSTTRKLLEKNKPFDISHLAAVNPQSFTLSTRDNLPNNQ